VQTLEQAHGGKIARRFGTVEQALAHIEPHLWPYFLHPPQGQPFVPPAGHTTEHVAVAHVNHGRWIARCPFCPSAQHVSKNDPRFFCAGCLNAAVDNRTVPVAWTDKHERIEELLGARPFVTTRNWFPHETLKDLARENKEHGVKS
jgi:hypothetical protein